MERQNAIILSWLEESDEDCDVSVQNMTSDQSDAPSEHFSDHLSDVEEDGEEGNGRIDPVPVNPGNSSNSQYILGKDNDTKWEIHVPKTSKTCRQNIITQLPGVKPAARQCKSIVECWKLFFPDTTTSDLVYYTNQRLDKLRANYSRGNRDCPPTDFEELSAFLGLLYLLGTKKAQHLNTDEMWRSDGTAPDIFVATMSEKRFHMLVRAIRFDDETTRDVRKLLDNLAPIRHIFEQFVKKSQECYTLGAFTTLDEMMEPFRGKCKFRVYMPNKPAKYGIKIYALVDARTFYTYYMEVYPGKQPPNSPYNVDNSAYSVVKRCAEPITKSGRNITMDNFFSSVPLFNELFTNHRTTAIGTLRKNKPQIPPLFLETKGRPSPSSLFAFGRVPNRCTIVSYIQEKKNKKNVILISTLHKDDAIDESTNDAQKPEIITDYNLTKGGVDVVDRLKSEYSVSRISNRWPLTLFCGLLNVGVINAQIIFRSNNDTVLSRRAFISELGKQLVTPHLMRRASIEHLSIPLKQKIKGITGIETNNPQPRPTNEKVRCKYCPVRKNRFTQTRCNECRGAVCKEHTASTIVVCQECHNLQMDIE